MEALVETNYSIDTFYFLVMGALVMFMAPGFAMLEAGLVRAKNTAEILTKNVALFAIACIMYLFFGYALMYGNVTEGAWIPGFGMGIGAENTAAEVLASGGETYYSARSDYFFQVVFVATAMSIVSGAVAERMKLWAFLAFAVVMTGFIYPIQGSWSWGGGALAAAGASRGSFRATSQKRSLTLAAVFADVSTKCNPFSSAYAAASSTETCRISLMSLLFPASAITRFA